MVTQMSVPELEKLLNGAQARVNELVKRRNELQQANNDLLTRARLAEQETVFWQHEAEKWATMLAGYRQHVEKYDRKLSVYVDNLRSLALSGFVMDIVFGIVGLYSMWWFWIR